eukprot:258556_1
MTIQKPPMFFLHACFVVILASLTAVSLSTNPLSEWWKPIDIGSVALLDTSSYIDPYRTDTSRFRPFVYGYAGASSTTTSTTTQSFDECMEKCIEDADCHAFEINMLFLPFQCRVSVTPCPEGVCSQFTSHPEWKHFVRDNDDTHLSVKSTVSLDTLDGIYKEREVAKTHGYSVVELTNDKNFDYMEVETSDALPNSISVDYVWFEYKETAQSMWLKCQRVQLPRVKSKYRVQNMCIQYEFTGAAKSECDVLKESWEYHSITPRTTKIRNIHFDDTEPSLKTCSDNLVTDPGTKSKIRYQKLGKVHAVRLFSPAGKFEVTKIALVTLQEIFAEEPTIVTQSGDNAFRLPQNTTAISDDPRNMVSDWYYNIVKDGGHLWCRNPRNSSNPITATNVFQRMHHTCYYRGSTLSKKTNSAMSDEERIHYFTPAQCSFDTHKIPSCTKAWVEIHERCQGWEYCAVSLAEATNVKVYHKGGVSLNNVYRGQDVDFPIVSWTSGWNRAQSKESEYNWSLDYTTDVLLVLHDCQDTFHDFSGCSQCSSPYYEAEYNPDIKYEDLRIYKYSKDEQYCRPQPGLYENDCKKNFFCPKGSSKNDFTDHQYWTCRTNFNAKQKVSTGTDITEQEVNQGFGCFLN